LQYGAALVYNGKDGRTTTTLARYLGHRATGQPLTGSADIGERDEIFVPAGLFFSV
jgi:hypothetical protein